MVNNTITPPVKLGDVLKLGIERFGKDGDPIMIHKGYIIFLKDIKERGIALNTMIEIKITKVSVKYAFAVRTSQ